MSSTSMCIRKCNKNLGRFRSHFLKTIGYFSKFWSFFRIAITENFYWNQLKLATQHKYINTCTCMYVSKNSINNGRFMYMYMTM